MILTGIIISTLVHLLSPLRLEAGERLAGYLISIIITVIIWEGNLRLDEWANKRYPWMISPGKRVLVQGFLALLYSSSTIFILGYFDSLIMGF